MEKTKEQREAESKAWWANYLAEKEAEVNPQWEAYQLSLKQAEARRIAEENGEPKNFEVEFYTMSDCRGKAIVSAKTAKEAEKIVNDDFEKYNSVGIITSRRAE